MKLCNGISEDFPSSLYHFVIFIYISDNEIDNLHLILVRLPPTQSSLGLVTELECSKVTSKGTRNLDQDLILLLDLRYSTHIGGSLHREKMSCMTLRKEDCWGAYWPPLPLLWGFLAVMHTPTSVAIMDTVLAKTWMNKHCHFGSCASSSEIELCLIAPVSLTLLWLFF